MKFSKIMTVLLLAAASAVFVSCKDDEDEDITKESLTGRITLPLPDYLFRGEARTFKLDTLASLSRSDGSAIGYYFKDPATGNCDTLVFDGGIANPAFPDGVFTITAPDELGSFSATLTGYSDGYYVTSAIAYFNTVDPSLDGSGSITGFEPIPGQGSFVDSRDSYKYFTVSAAGLDWTRQNLSWDGAGVPYSGAEAMSRIFGRYYTWEEAVSACPAGWRLPTDAEWKALASIAGSPVEGVEDIPGAAASIMGDMYFNGAKLWEYWPAVKISNATGLSAISCGYAVGTGSVPDFIGTGSYAVFWTADKSGRTAAYRYIYQDNNTFFRGDADLTDFRASVRCVR